MAGRTLDAQIECVRRNGNHGTVSALRGRVLESVGIPKPKETAENLIIFGCYLPFTIPLLLRDYIKILDHLGMDYTYLEKEFCCGVPMIATATGEEREKAIRAGREFMRMNSDLAQRKGATTLSYCCVGCAHAAKSTFPDESSRHVHYPDLIIERLEEETLRIAPTVVGYYEGCHRRYSDLAPGVSLDWGRYRRLLDRIEGLKVVDLPHGICCLEYPERIIEAAEKKNLDTILCSCVGCYTRVRARAEGRVQMKFLPELLLQSLRGE